MGERRAACRRRSRKSLCGGAGSSWSCGCFSSSPCWSCSGGSNRLGLRCPPRLPPPSPPPSGPRSHGSRPRPSYRRLIHGFEEVLRRRLRGRMRASWLSPSVRSGIAITTQRKELTDCEALLETVLFSPH